MKKTLLLLASLLMTMGTFADEVTFDFVKNGLSMFPGITAGSTQDGQDASTLTHDGDITENKTTTIDGVTLEVTPSGGKNPNRLWTASTSGETTLRYYGGTMTFTATKNIKSIEFEDDNKWTDPTADNGTLSNKIWTGDAASVTLTFGKQCRIKSIKVVYGDGDVPPVETTSYKKVTEISDGSYLIVADADGALKAATPLSKAYGYLQVADVAANNDVIATEEGNEFKFTSVDGGYTIQQADGKYLYMKGTYNSFNVSESRTDGDVFTVVANGDGTFKITNVAMDKYVQYSTQYTSYGAYADEKGIQPSLYKMEVATGVSHVAAEKQDADAPIYNLAGQRVSKNAKGILIQNGKKFIVK